MTLWLIILGMVAVTFTARLSVIALVGDTGMPPAITRALRFVPPAALAAIAVPEIVMPHGALDLSPDNARLIAGFVAAVIAWRTRSALRAIGVGMALLWLLTGQIG